MLTFVNIKFTSIVHVKKRKGCSGLQIYSKYCFVVRRVVFLLSFYTIVCRETNKIFRRPFFFLQPKHLNLVPRSSQLTVH